MKNIKDITISIFAIIGFVAILSSFNNQPQSQINYGTPESHIWEMYGAEGNSGFLLNKQTGEMRAVTMSGNRLILLKSIDKESN
jgi:hypothetical protein